MNSISTIHRTDGCIVCKNSARDALRGFCGHSFCNECISATDECPMCSIEMKCVICYEPFRQNNCSITPCGHRFCFKCITTHIVSSKRECPICRANLVEDDVYHRYMSSEEDEDEETEYDDDDEDEETEIASDDGNSETQPLDLERLTEQTMRKGITYRNLLEIISEFSGYYLGRGRMTEIHCMHNQLLDLMDDVVNETQEMADFANEDINILKFPTEAAAAAAVATASI